jgi:hypothetical protein
VPVIADSFRLMLFCSGGKETTRALLLWATTIFLALPEGATRFIASPEGGAVETSVRHGVLWLRLLVECMGA